MKRKPKLRCCGYTLLEVTVATAVLGLTIASALVAMRTGFAMIETARDNTLASQILQSEMENLRLRNWAQISTLVNGEFPLETTFEQTAAERFSRLRFVESPSADLRRITLEVNWTAYNGRPSTRRYVTYFSKDGLNDYYYRAFPQQ